MDPTLTGAIVGGIIGMGAGLCSIFLTDYFQRRRDDEQRDSDKRLLARALAAELRGICVHWRRVIEEKPVEEGKKVLMAGAEALCPVFDGAGYRLCLLPAEMVDETVTCYQQTKSVNEWLQTEGHLFTQIPLMEKAGLRVIDDILVERSTKMSAPKMEAAISQMELLAEELEAVAGDG